MTLSNWLTVSRILLVPVFLAFLLSDLPYGGLVSALVFALAAVTDGLDGWLARTRKETSYLGEVLDPFADKLLVSAALIALVELGKLSSWIAILIIGREFLVSGIRVLSIGLGKRVPASPWGKAKTVSQILAILYWTVLPGDSFEGYSGAHITAILLMGIAVALTVYSGADYFASALPLIGAANRADRRGDEGRDEKESTTGSR